MNIKSQDELLKTDGKFLTEEERAVAKCLSAQKYIRAIMVFSIMGAILLAVSVWNATVDVYPGLGIAATVIVSALLAFSLGKGWVEAEKAFDLVVDVYNRGWLKTSEEIPSIPKQDDAPEVTDADVPADEK